VNEFRVRAAGAENATRINLKGAFIAINRLTS
jgi:hypothetical protein